MIPLSPPPGTPALAPEQPHGPALEPSVGLPHLLESRLALLEAQTAEAARLIAELQARDRLKTQFLANISHDLRTPLTAIITHAEILRDGILGELSERQRTSILGIIKGGHQLLQMVGEILTYARGAADQLALSPTEVSLSSMVDQLMALNHPLAAKK